MICGEERSADHERVSFTQRNTASDEQRAFTIHDSRFAIRVIRDCWEKSENAREERRECLLDKHAHAVYQITNCESRINSNKRNKSVKHHELTILHRVGTLLTLCFHHQASS